MNDVVFTTAQAVAEGSTRREAAAARASGAWRPLGNGAYVQQAAWEAMDRRDRHLCVVQAALLTRQLPWHADRRSAALVHDLPLLGALPDQPQLVRQPLRTTDRSSSRHERLTSLPDHETAVRRTIPVTSLARTVVDIARSESFESAVVVADAALRQGLDLAQAAAIADRCVRWPGGRRVTSVLTFADGLSESALESISRVTMVRAGLPVPELQIEVWLGGLLLGRADALWRGCNLVGEADGRSKYDSPQVFYAEKRREEALEAAGLEVVRWDWRTARSARELEPLIRRGMARGALNVLDPRVRFVTTTVTDALRRQTDALRRQARAA